MFVEPSSPYPDERADHVSNEVRKECVGRNGESNDIPIALDRSVMNTPNRRRESSTTVLRER